jgi:F0F1-type ATP synthase alpha subunit
MEWHLNLEINSIWGCDFWKRSDVSEGHMLLIVKVFVSIPVGKGFIRRVVDALDILLMVNELINVRSSC